MKFTLPYAHARNAVRSIAGPLTICCFLFVSGARGQVTDSTSTSPLDKISDLPGNFFNRLTGKEKGLDAALVRQTRRYLKRMERAENKLQGSLAKKDSAAASSLFAGVHEKYAALDKLLTDTAAGTTGSGGKAALNGGYMPYTDSLSGMMAFLKQNPSNLQSPAQQHQLAAAADQLKQLDAHFLACSEITAFIRERKQQLAQALAGNGDLNIPVIREYFDAYRQEAYYYSEQVRVFKEALNDPDKMEMLALKVLDKFPAWQEFMQKNSILARLFPTPANLGSPLALAGLQTRSMMQQVVQTQLSSGPNAAAAFSQNMEDAQNKLGELRDRILQNGQGGQDLEGMPSFVPNNQRTRTFFKRLEYGANLQSTRSSIYFPVTTDIGLSVGYRLNNNGILGVGASYKLGWGRDINHITFTSQGAGLRSYLDWKVKKTIYVTGGYEYNYQSSVNRSMQLPRIDLWQKSGLLGITKTISIKSKFFKATKWQLLWDFLSYSQIPKAQPFLFRVGYTW